MKTITPVPSRHPEMPRRPSARKRELVVQDVGEETLVYDLSRHKAHCLNRSAKLLWSNCDGQRSVKEIRTILAKDIDGSIDDSWILFGIAQLEKAHLLEERITTREEGAILTRREMAKRVGWAALIAVPVVSSILAPTVQAAASCLAAGAPCTTSVQCCTGVCNVNVCL